MLTTRLVVSTVSVGLMILGAGVVSGQNYPNKPVRIVTPEPGGSGDVMARLIAQGISSPLGQPVIVDNRGGLIPMEVVAKAPHDGYTLLFHNSSVWINSFIQTMSYDPVKDFSPITLVTRQPNILLVHSSSSIKSVKELIALAKAKPGELNYASGPSGGTSHLAPELFKAMAGVNIVRIPYKGNGPALNALIGGEVHLMFVSPASGMPHVKSGRLRALAVTSAQPSELLPGLPTVAATGLPGYEATSIFGIWAPGGTPPTFINRLNQEIVRFLKTPDAKERFLDSGVEAVGSSPEQFAAAIKVDMVTWSKVIKDAGIRAE